MIFYAILLMTNLPLEFRAGVAQGAQEDAVVETFSFSGMDGAPIASAEIRSEVHIDSDLTNNEEEEDSIAHITQVRDPEDRVVFLSYATFSLQGKERKTVHSVWDPEEEGGHLVQVFVWRDSEPPIPLSLSFAEIYVSSPNKIECRGTASCVNGVVTKIIDGDTIDVNDFRVRFALVDTPEIGEPGYKEASAFTAAVCPIGSRVLVDEDDGQRSGSYGRMIAKVFCGSRLINEELLESGHAVILVRYCDESEFRDEDWASKFGCL